MGATAQRLSRAGWMTAGFGAVGVGGVGVVLPVLPSTVFFIMAAWCFSHSSPRFEKWVLNLPKVGPMVADYRAGLGMGRRAKIIAIGTMATAVTASAMLVNDRPALLVGLIALGLVGAAYVGWRVPTTERVLEQVPPA